MMMCLTTTGLDSFRVRTIFRNFLHQCGNHRSGKVYAIYCSCLLLSFNKFRVKLERCVTRVLCSFQRLIVG